MDYEAFAARAKSAFDDCSEMKRMLWNIQSVVGAVPDMVRKNERLDRERAELKAEIERLRSEIPGDYMKLPVDADGVPIEVGDVVYYFAEKANEPVVGYGPFRVIGFDAEGGAVKLRYEEGGTDHYGNYSEDFELAKLLTHCEPDSWEKLEEDALKGSCTYMITDKERRRIAQNLRNSRYRLKPVPSGKQVMSMTRAASELELAHEGNYLNQSGFERLADLIDRPTTSIDVNKHGRAYCINCGCDDWCLADGDAHYCPKCGAEVCDDD